MDEAMKEQDIDIELEPGLDGADTRDSDDAATGAGDALRAKKKRPSKRRINKGSDDRESPRPSR